jgi:hypothetical protein
MDRKVDLTRNRDFSNFGFRQEFASFLRDIFGKYPWAINEEIHSYDDNSDNDEKRELILTGSRKDRLQKKRYLQEISGKYCDCCGRLIVRVPWSFPDCPRLCDRCAKEFEIQRECRTSFPWKPKTREYENPLLKFYDYRNRL